MQPDFPPPGAPGSPWPAPGLIYAGFWRRAGGFIIDTLILSIVNAAFSWPLYISDAVRAQIDQIRAQWNSLSLQSGGGTFHVIPIVVTNVVPTWQYALAILLSTVIALLYWTLFVSLTGSTPGQKAAGLHVVSENDASTRLSMRNALLRSIPYWMTTPVRFLSGAWGPAVLLQLLSFLWVAWDPHKQGLHDKLGNAIVVRTAPAWAMPPAAPVAPAPAPPPATPA